MANNTQIKVSADVSDAEKAFNKLRKTMGDIDDTTTEISPVEALTKQQQKVLEKLSKSLENGLKGFQQEHSRVIDSIAKKQKELEDQLSKARSKAKKEQLSSGIEELKKQKKAYDTDSKTIHEQYQKRRKGLDNYGVTANTTSNNNGKPEEKDGKLATVLKYVNAFRGGGVGGLLQQGGKGLLGSSLGKLGIAGAITYGIFKIFQGMNNKFGKPTEQKDLETYKVVQDTEAYGKNYRNARRDFRNAGSEYGLKTQQSIDVAGNLIGSKGFTTKMQLKEDIASVAKFSAATGLDSNMSATKLGGLSSKSKTSIKDLTDLVSSASNSLGMTGRTDKVLEALERIADIGVETKGSIDKGYLQSYLNMAQGYKDEGMNGSVALEKSMNLMQQAGASGTIRATALSQATNLQEYNDIKSKLEYSDPEVLANSVRKLSRSGVGEDELVAMLNAEGMKVDDARRFIRGTIAPKTLEKGSTLDKKYDNYSKSEQYRKARWETKKEVGSEAIGDGFNSMNDFGRTMGLAATGAYKAMPRAYMGLEDQFAMRENTFTRNSSIVGSKRVYTAEELDEIIARKVQSYEEKSGKTSTLRGTGQYFLDAANRNNISVEALLGMAMFESAGGTSKQAQEKNNFFGYKSYNTDSSRATKFNSKENSISTVAKMLRESYVNANEQDTLWEVTSGVNGRHKYNIGNEQGWADGASKLANGILQEKDRLDQKIDVHIHGKIEGVTPQSEAELKEAFKKQLETNMTRG